MKENKNTFFIDVFKAITDFEKYKEFAFYKNSKVIKFIISFIILFSLLITIALSLPIFNTVKNGIEYFKNDFPDLSYKDGKLIVFSDTPIYLENSNSMDAILFIDTNATIEEQEKYIEEYKNHDTSLLVFDDKLILKTSALSSYMTYNYKQLEDNFEISEFTKQDILNNFEGANIYKIYISIYLVLFVYMLLTYTLIIILDVILLSILALLVAMIYKVKLKYINCLKISVYAFVLPLILQLIYIYINVFTGFTIEYFSFMYDIISYIYVVTAIIIMRNDLAKQDIGLINEEKIEDNTLHDNTISNEDIEKQKEKLKNQKKEKTKDKTNPDVEPGKA